MDEHVQKTNIEKRKVTTEPIEMLEDVPLDENNPKKYTMVGANMEKKTKQDLVQFLKKSIDVFTWSHEDMPGETPFKLAYGSEAVIPAEVYMAKHRVMKHKDKDNEEQLHLNFDLINEIRIDTKQRTIRYKNLMTRHYDAMVKPRCFNIGDLVLKKVSLANKNSVHGKLGPNWEGPYRVINCKRQGSYYLEALDGRKLEHP
ncbi:uncharacterized protein LOC142628677 [Castanea sativa]|uniref:uncharacterized protein LOC142628677 n=1 Tax=Castanea sativa TaxID=21020 RepID=UPI003F652A21